ncbi:MAG: hypothetical protein AB3N64_12780 [Puniceicoccaceae bacterium]
MNKHKYLSKLTTLLAFFALGTFPVLVQAESFETSGSATYIVTDNQVTTHANGTTTIVQTSKTIIECDDESVSFHKAPQTAIGTIVQDAEGNVIANMGYCYAVDADGDVMYLNWRMVGNGSEWSFVSGTGKYENIEGGGTSEVLALMEDGSQMIRWHGKWTQE